MKAMSFKHGFTQLSNRVLKEKRFSFGARLTYAVLLSYAWGKESCFPGQDRMTEDLGVSARSIRILRTQPPLQCVVIFIVVVGAEGYVPRPPRQDRQNLTTG